MMPSYMTPERPADLISADGSVKYAGGRVRTTDASHQMAHVVSPDRSSATNEAPRTGLMKVAGASDQPATGGGAGPGATPIAPIDKSPDRLQMLRAESAARIEQQLVAHVTEPTNALADRQQPLMDGKRRVDMPRDRTNHEHFLGSAKKRVGTADATMHGITRPDSPTAAADALSEVKIFASKRATPKPADRLKLEFQPPPTGASAPTDDPLRTGREEAAARMQSLASFATTPRRHCDRPADNGNLIAHDPCAAAGPIAAVATPGRPQSARGRGAPCPATDIFATQHCNTVPMPEKDAPIFTSKRREGPFTPRDNLRPNAQFA